MEPTRRRLFEAGVDAGIFAISGVATIDLNMAKADTVQPDTSDLSDVALIALCERFDALQRHYRHIYEVQWRDDDDAADAAARPVHEALAIILDRICNLQAVSIGGLMARAKTLMQRGCSLIEDADERYWDERMLLALIRDLTA